MWTEVIASTAYQAVDSSGPYGYGFISDALAEAGLECARRTCRAALEEPPSRTGYHCAEHRTGPDGQPAILHPKTLIMYWLDGRTLMHAVADPHDYQPGTPVDADPAEDVEAYLVACDVEEFMRSGVTTWPTDGED